MTRIAMVTQGGVARPGTVGFMPSLYDFVARLSHRFDITVYGTTDRPGEGQTFLCGNARVILTNTTFKDDIFRKLRVLGRAILKDHRRNPYMLVHGQWALPGGLIAVLAAKALRIPSVITTRGADAAAVPEVGYGHFLKMRTRIPTLWTLRNATVVTTLTDFQRKQLKNFGLLRNDIRVIPTGVDTAMFRPASRPDPPPVHFLHVGNITPVKNQRALLELFAILSESIEARLRLIGPDYQNGTLQKVAGKMGLEKRVEFVGRVKHEDLPMHYQWAHLLLHTSYYEGQGLVIAEAASSGAIPCGTRVGLMADLDEVCVVSSPARDLEGLAKKILDLLHDRDRIRHLREKGREWTGEYDINWTVNQFARLYNELVPAVGEIRD